MKKIILIAFIFSLMSNLALAGQVDTECPWMKEQNERTNPKASGVKSPVNVRSSSKAIRK